MFNKYLKALSEIDINLISTKKKGKQYLNVAIFGNSIPSNLLNYKKEFFTKLTKKKDKINKISKIVTKSKKLTIFHKDILKNEIFIRFKKIEFLKRVYDIEANKLDKNYKVKEIIKDYDYYNNIFFGVTKNDIKSDIKMSKNKDYNIFISKKKLKQLLAFSKEMLPELNWHFGNYTSLSHNKGLLKIPNQNKYHIKTIIILFFHETTHFFRYVNGLNNFGFNYTFSDSLLFEEGIAVYNEYYYGNKIIDYGKYIPYTEICLNFLLKKNTLEEKKKEIYDILKYKGFNKQKSLDYFYRFYRYTIIGGKELFLKDLLYSKGYKKIKNLIKENKINYTKIMVGKIGLFELKYNIVKLKNNFNDKLFFETIVREIKKLILKKGTKYL